MTAPDPLSGLDFDDLPPGFIPLEAILSIKALTPEGDVCLISRITPELNPWEALGMAMSLSDDLRASLAPGRTHEYDPEMDGE